MSQLQTSLSPAIKRLRDEGYSVCLVGGHLVVRDVPYVNASKAIEHGILVCPLSGSGADLRPERHVVFFAGEIPCDELGNKVSGVAITAATQTLGGVAVQWQFSSKPARGHYLDSWEQITSYVRILLHPARALDPSATACVFKPVEGDADSVFNYVDTASSRAKIDDISNRLAIPKLAIVGMGGTGGYVLDSAAKCPIGEINIYDADFFLNHNAFRAPGAASLDELNDRPRKVHYFAAIYSKMHRHIIPHAYDINGNNVGELREMSFIFLCIDRSKDKEVIVRQLQEWEMPFIDVGMGLKIVGDQLTGLVRTTASSKRLQNHIWEKGRISFADAPDPDNEYATNIQVSDLNALNALMAVIKWKKSCGFYADMDDEHYSHYVLNSNKIVNDDRPGEIHDTSPRIP